MNIKNVFLAMLFFSLSLFVPRVSQALDLQQVFTSENSIVVKVQEGIEYFFAFRVENKVVVLEKHAEKRLVMAQDYAEKENNEKVQNMIQNYQQIKEKQNDLLGKTNNEDVLGQVTERTIEQQRTMEEIKTNINEEGKQNVIQVQEQVANQVAKHVIDVNGPEGATEFLNDVAHVWAPGTGPGGEAGVVIEGGSIQFAPGTSAGGPATQDIKTVEVKTGGETNDPVPEQDGPNYAPGTTGNSPGNTVESGDSGTDNTRTWIDP